MKLDVSNTDFLNSKPAKKTTSLNAAACRDLIHDQCIQGFEALETYRGSLLHKGILNVLRVFLSKPGQTRRPEHTSFL